MFKPDLVYFDEAPHAHELSNLIAIDNFNPIAWIFCGDYCQTIPYVGSSEESIYREQMQVSMMERAARAGVIHHELSMNHRAFGGLHKMASTLWYNSCTISGNGDRTPVSLEHIRKYLSKLSGRTYTIPRLLAHIKSCGPEALDRTSAWNPEHHKWVMVGSCPALDRHLPWNKRLTFLGARLGTS